MGFDISVETYSERVWRTNFEERSKYSIVEIKMLNVCDEIYGRIDVAEEK